LTIDNFFAGLRPEAPNTKQYATDCQKRWETTADYGSWYYRRGCADNARVAISAADIRGKE